MVRISRLEIENIKRVQAVQVEPAPTGLTLIGGRNRQGKTSVLDAIMWALGGGKYKPSEPKREGSMADPRVQIQLDNGIVVTRDGKNATLKVVDETGNKAGQALLDELIGQLALDLPRFIQASGKDKAETLLQIIGVGDQLAALDRKAQQLYNERHAIGQVHIRKKKHAEDLPFEQDVPEEEISASDLIQQQQTILARNGENQRLRSQRDELGRLVESQQRTVDALKNQLRQAQESLDNLRKQLNVAVKSAEDLQDESTTELEKVLRDIDDTNRRIRVNLDKHRAESEASALNDQVIALTDQLDQVRAERKQLLDSAQLPLPGLSIVDGELVYLNQKWDCMSSADQLRVAVAIVRQLRPTCQFVLMDKLEQMDLDTLVEFGQWLELEGLQAIATRVSTGGECSLIIEDGLVVGTKPTPAKVATVAPAMTFEDEGF